MFSAKVSFAHGLTAKDRGFVALFDDLASVQHVNVVRQRQDQPDVVFDQQHTALQFVGDAPDDLGEVFGLLLGHASGRFVQQQKVRGKHQSAGNANALHLAASPDYLARAPALNTPADLRQHKVVGYIQDMIFDAGLDYASELGLPQEGLHSNSVLVQLGLLRAGAGVGVVHDFARPSAPELVTVLPDQALHRAFYLLRHADAAGSARLGRFAELLTAGIRRETLRLEAIVGATS